MSVAVPEIPEAAYRASIPPPGIVPGSTTGVSGGGGEPRLARVVEFEAVDAKRFTPWSPLGAWVDEELAVVVVVVVVVAAPGGG